MPARRWKNIGTGLPAKLDATYQDVLDAPANLTAEILYGDLFLSPAPALPHGSLSARLAGLLSPRFEHWHGGRGEWHFVITPELKLRPRRGPRLTQPHAMNPDLAGWRVERMPAVGQVASVSLAPDWVCEVISKSTERIDRGRKLSAYGYAGVPHLWFIDQRRRTLELYTQDAKLAQLVLHEVYTGDLRARIAPFGELVFDLRRLWSHMPPPTLVANEGTAEYLTAP